jgi:hypothetical protein
MGTKHYEAHTEWTFKSFYSRHQALNLFKTSLLRCNGHRLLSNQINLTTWQLPCDAKNRSIFVIHTYCNIFSQSPPIFLYNILGFVRWWSSFPSIRPVIQVPHPWMEEEEDDDEWRSQQFYPNVISGACSRACWWWGAWAVASDDGHRCWPFLGA